MHWGYTAATREGPVEVTLSEQMLAFGLEPPECPELPELGLAAWSAFWELNARRPPGFDSLSPFSYTEIHHWLNIMGRQLLREEIQWLIDMDDAWLAAIREERDAAQERKKEESETKKGKAW